MGEGRLVPNYGVTNMAPTQKNPIPPLVKDKAPTSKHVNSLGTNKNMCMGLNRAPYQE